MDNEYDRIASAILSRARNHKNKRFIVAVAGIPGAGKTTTASAVAQRLNAGASPTKTALLSLDGFHLSRATLDQLPNREEAYIRRGAPWTFDAPRFIAFVRRLRDWADSEPTPHSETDSASSSIIYGPSFDHATKDPVEDGIAITDDVSILILEGNYLLLDEADWRDVAQLVDYRVFIDTDLQVARERVAKRHLSAGIESTLEGGFRRVDSNDYLNALTIREKLIVPDMVVHSIQESA